MKDVLHFVHGNGFPSPCYNQLLHFLETRYECCYIDKVGHCPQFPVTDNWHYLVDEVIENIKIKSSTPVIGVGHSLGGVLSLLAAIEQPTLFKAVILLDSPLLGRLKSNIVRFSKAIGLIDRLTPAKRSRLRRVHWQSRSEVLAYLKSRSLFKSFTEACLEDYIDFGLDKNESGFSLRFNPEIEYQIYRTIPHLLMQYEGRLKVPTTLIYGNQSRVIDRLDLRYMKNKYHVNHVQIQGTHMFPMEYPEATANLIMKVLSKE